MTPNTRKPWSRPFRLRLLVGLLAGVALAAWTTMIAGWLVAEHRLSALAAQTTKDIKALSATGELESALLSHRREVVLWEMTADQIHRQAGEDYLQSARLAADRILGNVTSKDEARRLDEIKTALAAISAAPETQAEDTAALSTVAERFRRALQADDLLALVRQLRSENERRANESVLASHRLLQRLTYWAAGLSLATTAALVLGAIMLSRRIVLPVLGLSEAARRFGRGDFTARATVFRDDELGEAARTFNNMADDIAEREQNRLYFIAMTLHDLKNPVMALEIAGKALADPDISDEDRRFYVEGIADEAKRLRKIVRELTDDIQIATGNFRVNRSPIDLGEFVGNLLKAEAAILANHQVHTRFDDGCVVEADPDKLYRVVANVIGNAAKYSPAGSAISIEVHRSHQYAVVSVLDQGPGIPAQDQKVIFQPFGRGQVGGHEGSGLGLFVAKRIVDAHGGRISLTSRPGHGTTIRIRLPLRAEE